MTLLNVFVCTINAECPSDPAVEDVAKTITRVSPISGDMGDSVIKNGGSKEH